VTVLRPPQVLHVLGKWPWPAASPR